MMLYLLYMTPRTLLPQLFVAASSSSSSALDDDEIISLPQQEMMVRPEAPELDWHWVARDQVM